MISKWLVDGRGLFQWSLLQGGCISMWVGNARWTIVTGLLGGSDKIGVMCAFTLSPPYGLHSFLCAHTHIHIHIHTHTPLLGPFTVKPHHASTRQTSPPSPSLSTSYTITSASLLPVADV